MKKIPLTKGKIALVDDEDFERLNKNKWCYSGSYAQRRISNTKNLYMHRFIMAEPVGKQIDHINGNPLDNRKSNLRLAIQHQNLMNQKKHENNTSGYKGVVWDRKAGKWLAHLMFKYKNYHLGRHATKEAAAKAYNQKAKELFGEFARLNTI